MQKKISIITPSYNQGKYIEKNILSVLNQGYENFEHIIVDGGSTDETIKILKKYKHLEWFSEPDEGQADALNKGLKIATGEIIGWLNSDDYYLPNTFQIIDNEFKNNNIQWIIGNLRFSYISVNRYQDIISPEISFQKLIRNPDIVKQQSAFFRKKLLDTAGGFNKKYYMVMDFDLWIRLSKISEPKHINNSLAVFVIHKEQKSNFNNLYLQTKELSEIMIREGVNFFNILLLISKKLYYLLKSYIKLILIKIKIIDKKYLYIPISKH